MHCKELNLGPNKAKSRSLDQKLRWTCNATYSEYGSGCRQRARRDLSCSHYLLEYVVVAETRDDVAPSMSRSISRPKTTLMAGCTNVTQLSIAD